jgi:hypothetical protein
LARHRVQKGRRHETGGRRKRQIDTLIIAA